jgi:hypothetical protein
LRPIFRPSFKPFLQLSLKRHLVWGGELEVEISPTKVQAKLQAFFAANPQEMSLKLKKILAIETDFQVAFEITQPNDHVN